MTLIFFFRPLKFSFQVLIADINTGTIFQILIQVQFSCKFLSISLIYAQCINQGKTLKTRHSRSGRLVLIIQITQDKLYTFSAVFQSYNGEGAGKRRILCIILLSLNHVKNPYICMQIV